MGAFDYMQCGCIAIFVLSARQSSAWALSDRVYMVFGTRAAPRIAPHYFSRSFYFFLSILIFPFFGQSEWRRRVGGVGVNREYATLRLEDRIFLWACQKRTANLTVWNARRFSGVACRTKAREWEKFRSTRIRRASEVKAPRTYAYALFTRAKRYYARLSTYTLANDAPLPSTHASETRRTRSDGEYVWICSTHP